jgi:hypothetical protein
MRFPARLVLVVAMIAAGPVLSACDSFDSLELFDTEKKLEGQRKPVFPEGVPGVSSGVPAELVKGYREPDSGPADPARAAAEAVSDSKPKKPAPPQRTASKPKPQPAAAQSQPQPSPWPGSR